MTPTPRAQFGEDRLVAAILLTLYPEDHLHLVEFGAGDGIELSNTKYIADLWQHTCTRHLAEADEGLYEKMIENWSGDYMHHTTVSWSTKSASHPDRLFQCPDDIHLLSIDIDGDDWHVWSSIERLKPLVVVIEYNPTIPYNIDAVQIPGQRVGSSSLAMYLLGRRKGYSLACMTSTNCIFVRSDRFGELNQPPRSFALKHALGVPGGSSTCMVSNYDGWWHLLYKRDHMWGTTGLTVDTSLSAAMFQHVNHWHEPERIERLHTVPVS